MGATAWSLTASGMDDRLLLNISKVHVDGFCHQKCLQLLTRLLFSVLPGLVHRESLVTLAGS